MQIRLIFTRISLHAHSSNGAILFCNLECLWSNSINKEYEWPYSQDFFEKQKIKEDKFLWVSFVIFLVLRAMHTICLYAVCLNYACISHVLLNIFFYLQNLQGHIFNFFSTYKKHFCKIGYLFLLHVQGWDGFYTRTY